MQNSGPNSNQQDHSTLKDYTTTITILEHLSDAIFILNQQGRVQYANRVALEMLGTDLPEILNHSFHEYISGSMDGDNEQPGYFIHQIYSGSFTEFETALVKGEYETPVVISFGLVSNNNGQISYIIASAKDITIKRELEKELVQQHLLTLSRDRYRELGELAVNMVHNLSQPLTSIRLMVELIEKLLAKKTIDKKGVRRNLQNILKSIDLMSQSISNVRNFAFLTEDDSLKHASVDSILQDAIRQMSYELQDKNVPVNIDGPQQQMWVCVNPMHLQQVFTILIRHVLQLAVDGARTSEKTSPEISITSDSYLDRWVTLRFAAQNLRSGLQERQNLRQNSLTYINSHLDLTMAQIILSSFGGDLNVVLSDQGGAVFKVRLPIDEREERAQLLNLIELLQDN